MVNLLAFLLLLLLNWLLLGQYNHTFVFSLKVKSTHYSMYGKLSITVLSKANVQLHFIINH